MDGTSKMAIPPPTSADRYVHRDEIASGGMDVVYRATDADLTVASIADLLATAIQHHQAGRLQAAVHIYRQILTVNANQGISSVLR
jgi:hypothetical protein